MLQKTPVSKDSKSVCEQSHVGSNPTRCASSSQATYRLRRVFHFIAKLIVRSFCCSSLPNRTRCRWAPVWVRRFPRGFMPSKKKKYLTSLLTSEKEFLPCSGSVFSYRKEISILTAPSTSEQSPLCSDVFLCMRQKRRHLPVPLLLLSNCDPLRWARGWCAALRATSQYQRLLTNPPAVQEEKFTIFAEGAPLYPGQFDYLTGGFSL